MEEGNEDIIEAKFYDAKVFSLANGTGHSLHLIQCIVTMQGYVHRKRYTVSSDGFTFIDCH